MPNPRDPSQSFAGRNVAPTPVAVLASSGSDAGPTMLFRYYPGSLVTGLPGGTFTRADAATCATYVDVNGLVQTVAANIIRDKHFVSGNQTTLLEPSRVNICLQNRDLSNAAWTKTNATAAKDQVGADGQANSASSLVATAGNGTCLQAITAANVAYQQSCWVKRITGVGTINMTLDNGATWTAITVTASWAPVTVPNQSVLNPTVGFQIVTNGDKIAVDYVQTEAGAYRTSAIATAGSTVTRAADALSFTFGQVPEAMTVYCDAFSNQASNFDGSFLWEIGTAAGTRVSCLKTNAAASITGTHKSAAGTVTSVPAATVTYGQEVETRTLLANTGAITQGVSVAGGAETVAGASAANTFDAAWAATTIFLNTDATPANNGSNAFRSIKVCVGNQSLAAMRAIR